MSGRKIAETAVRMSVADLSVLLTAVRRPAADNVTLMTLKGSDNYVLWSLMAKKGWLTDTGQPRHLRRRMASFSIVPEYRHLVHTVAIICCEGLGRGMTPQEIIAHGEGKKDPRLAHLG